MEDRLELKARRSEQGWKLYSPAAGLWTEAAGRDQPLASGMQAGVLLRLGRAARLIVPEGVAGRITSERPERVHAPIAYDDLLYELAPLEGLGDPLGASAGPATDIAGALVFSAPQTGRFYHRPAPGEPAFVAAGEWIETGRALGLIEVMKTFTHVLYRPGGSLPARARFVRYLCEHASDVRAGQALCELASD